MNIQIATIRDLLIAHVNKSELGREINLSVGESILLAIDACTKGKVEPQILDELNQLYLDGVKSKDDAQFVKELAEFLAEKNYCVKSDPKTINEDPTRRYFETQLAYNLIKYNAESLNYRDLCLFTKNLKERLFSLADVSKEYRAKVEHILKGNVTALGLNKYEQEYAELCGKLSNNDFHGLSEKACRNLYQIACSSILATLNTQVDNSMPIDIYNDSIFTFGMDGRGRLLKQGNDQVRTAAKGLMRASSPLPFYGDVANPVKRGYPAVPVTGEAPPQKPVANPFSLFQRSADQANFMIESQWSQHLFSRQTQPYSNGISSTTLAQIRNIIYQKRLGNVHHSGRFQKYMTAFTGLMVYNSGGHSFFEIFEVFKLPQFRALVKSEKGMTEALRDDRLMYKWLCLDQRKAFDKAIKDTLQYTQTLLYKKLVNTQLLMKEPLVSSQDIQESTVHINLFKMSPEAFADFLTSQSKEAIDSRNDQKWTASMVAAQLGKTKHLEALIKAGANINLRVRPDSKVNFELSALELAIKNERYEAVELLINAKAIIKRNNDKAGGLKNRSPALYLATRQHDTRIIELLLQKERGFSIADKKGAILTALIIENTEAVQTLFKCLSVAEKRLILTKSYKLTLLQEALKLGNPEFMRDMIQLTYSDSDAIDYELLFCTAIDRDFNPTAKALLDIANETGLSSNPKIVINLNKLLIEALNDKKFHRALTYIIYGANPEVMSTSGAYLVEFENYLKTNEHYYSLLFTKEKTDFIALRASQIERLAEANSNSTFSNILRFIVQLLNRILPQSMRSGYNDRLNVIASLSTVFTSNVPDNDELSEDEGPHEPPVSKTRHAFFPSTTESPESRTSPNEKFDAPAP